MSIETRQVLLVPLFIPAAARAAKHNWDEVTVLSYAVEVFPSLGHFLHEFILCLDLIFWRLIFEAAGRRRVDWTYQGVLILELLIEAKYEVE